MPDGTLGVNPKFLNPESVKSETGLETATFGDDETIEEIVIEF